jgi:hypothetical protein
MSDELILLLVSGALIVAILVFFMVIKRLSRFFYKYVAKIERKAGDVAIYLSHVNEDKNHIEKVAANKIDSNWAETHLSDAFSELKGKSEGKARIRVMVSSK